MRKRWPNKSIAGYAATLVACFFIAVLAAYTAFANQVDNSMYDWIFRLNPPHPQASQAVVVTIDDTTFKAMGGVRKLRAITAEALERIENAHPKVTVIDLILVDEGDRAEDARLEAAFRRTSNLVLATDLVDGMWENPRPPFRKSAAAVGHALADEESPDGVTREISLARSGNHEGHWALALEAYRLARGARFVVDSPGSLQIAGTVIPARRHANGKRPLLIRYRQDALPRITVKELVDRPELASGLSGRIVFLGVYSNTAARDRVVTPYGDHISGVEVNGEAFETLAGGQLLSEVSSSSVLGVCLLTAALGGMIFALLAGWPAYVLGAILIATVHAFPFFMFRQGVVFPYFAPAATAWFTVMGASVYQHFVIRRRLRSSETERSRYREAIHWVTHEMRSPLTAIQGSSELMGRYNLNDDKRKQIAQMINSESKRLARMIQTFLDVERLSEGQLDLKRQTFTAGGLVQSCLERVQSLAERKDIRIQETVAPEERQLSLYGDRELMEYVIYNLLTNAIKYSPAGTTVIVSGSSEDGYVRLSVKDQGIGMDARELRNIFRKFYRTRRAEASGEAGTGLGLSIVEQIVKRHDGHMEVTSTPNQGSCFTVVLPAPIANTLGSALSNAFTEPRG